MKAFWNEILIAESNDTVVVEGNHYFPIDSVGSTYLKISETKTLCPWKGTASYYTIVADGLENKDAAWYYDSPKPAASKINGRLAFWKGIKIED